MEKKKYYVLNYNCDNDTHTIELTDMEYQAIMRYYDIMDDMGVAQEISPPITKEQWEEDLQADLDEE